MFPFVQRFASCVSGVLSGWDRIRFRGTKRLLANVRGMMGFLWQVQVRLTEFRCFVEDVTATLRRGVEQQAQTQQLPVTYLASSRTNKEQAALQVARQHDRRQGLLAILSCVEPCVSYGVHKNAATRQLELRLGEKKCLHYYHYFRHPQLGLLHTRLQSWFPLTMQVCLNGREWLARQMDQDGIGYVRRDNCFVQLADAARAQALMDQQLHSNWPELLDELARQSNPAHHELFTARPVPYYWSVDESEWATDVLFDSAAALAALAPRLYRHGIDRLHSSDVLRFLGRKVKAEGEVHPNLRREVITDLKGRPEGMRIKHALGRNWIKMYDKQGSVLRVETVINDPRDLKVYRPKEGDPAGAKDWRYLRKGVADLHRRAEVSQKANERYLESLATIEERRTVAELSADVCRPVQWHGRRVRGLQPLAGADARLLEVVNRGEFLLNGFRNRDVRGLLFERAAGDGAEQRRQAAAVTRKLRLLRAHGLIRKVPKTHRYVLSEKGQTVGTALQAVRQADPAKLTATA